MIVAQPLSESWSVSELQLWRQPQTDRFSSSKQALFLLTPSFREKRAEKKCQFLSWHGRNIASQVRDVFPGNDASGWGEVFVLLFPAEGYNLIMQLTEKPTGKG